MKYKTAPLLFIITIILIASIWKIDYHNGIKAINIREQSKIQDDGSQDTINSYIIKTETIIIKEENLDVDMEAKNIEDNLYTPLYTEKDLHVLALVLSGECYDFEVEDKNYVAWVACNRVDDGRFGGSDIVSVLSSKKYGVQFVGYWHQSRSISDSDYDVAAEVLTAWYSGEDAPHEYLYFSSGIGTKNVFR